MQVSVMQFDPLSNDLADLGPGYSMSYGTASGVLPEHLPIADEALMRTWSDIRPPLDQAGRIQGVLAGEGAQGTPAANFEFDQFDTDSDSTSKFFRYVTALSFDF